jgi:protein-tyrosine-phosphatase
MSEKGISLEGQWSKGLRDVAVAEMDVVVSMGREVEFPVPAGFKGREVAWDIPDPYGRSMKSSRNVRDMIERKVLGLLADLLAPDVSA